MAKQKKDKTLAALTKNVEKMEKDVRSGKFKGSLVDRMRPLQMLNNYNMFKFQAQIENEQQKTKE